MLSSCDKRGVISPDLADRFRSYPYKHAIRLLVESMYFGYLQTLPASGVYFLFPLEYLPPEGILESGNRQFSDRSFWVFLTLTIREKKTTKAF